MDSHPDLKLIMAPTTVGIAAAAKAMQDEGLCETIKVSGLGLPDEMKLYTKTVAHRSSPLELRRPRLRHLLRRIRSANGDFEAAEGASFEAGRMGSYTIEKDPTRDEGLRIVMGPFTVYDETNVGG